MKTNLKAVLVSASLFIALQVGTADSMTTKPEVKWDAKTNLLAASRWLIENGVAAYVEGGMRYGINSKLGKEWAVSVMTSDISFETGLDPTRFPMRARRVSCDVRLIYREAVDEGFVEFWVVKVNADDQSIVESSFFVTFTATIKSVREILEESDQFIESYTHHNETITMPTDDLLLRYSLEAWRYPKNYENTDIDEYVIEAGRKDNKTYFWVKDN